MNYLNIPTQAFHELDAYEFRLFSFYLLKTSLGLNECSDTLAQTAKESNISTVKTTHCRKSLMAKGYIHAEPYFGGRNNRYRVTINDSYLQNNSNSTPIS